MSLSKILSSKLTDRLLTYHFIEPDKRKYYEYTFDYFFDFIMYIISIIFTGCIFRVPILAILYLLLLCPLKMISGGAHASTHLSYTIISYSVCIITLLICKYCPIPITIQISIYLLSLIISVFLTPVDHPNKRLNAQQKSRHKHIFIILSVGVSLLFVITIIFNQNPYSCLISIINFIISLNLICGVIIDRSQ